MPSQKARATTTTLYGTEWKIEKSSKYCSVCERQFVEEELYFSALYDEIQRFARKDFCLPCWQRDEKVTVFSFWKTRIPKADTPPKKHIDNSILMEVFLRLEGNPDPEKKKLRYALALFLMRKKLFRYKNIVRNNGQELLLLEYLQENKVFEVIDPLLTEEEIATLTGNLVRLFDLEDAEFLPLS